MNQANATNRQSNLSGFFDFSAGMGAYVPKKSQAYASKRLQDVVADFRRQRASGLSIHGPEGSSRQLESEGGQDGSAKKKRKTGRGSENKATTTTSKRKTKNRKGKRKVSDADDEGVEADIPEGLTTPPPLTVQLRPRPKRGRN